MVQFSIGSCKPIPVQAQSNLESCTFDNAFDLERVNKSGARFDPDKIKWFNHQYMQEQNNDELAEVFKNLHSELATIDVNYISIVVGMIKERATFVSDFWELSSYFFQAPLSYDEKASKKAVKEDTKSLMQELKKGKQ